MGQDGGMNKVYIVTSGEYSDYSIQGVFPEADKAKAEEYARLCNGNAEEWDLSGEWTKDQGKFQFGFGLDGSILYEKYEPHIESLTDLNVSQHCHHHEGVTGPLCIYVTINRGNRDLALKIASERYTRIRASMDDAMVLVDRIKVDHEHFRPMLYVMVAEVLSGIAKAPDPPKCGFDHIILQALRATS